MTPEGNEKPLSFFRRKGEEERPHPAPGLTVGKVVGEFRLVALIGQGGMGQVWEADQVSLKRRVAVKFVRPERVTAHQLELFAREARAGGRLSHPGIVGVYGHGESDGLAWIAMEFVAGAWTLKDLLDEAARAAEVPEGYDRHVAAPSRSPRSAPGSTRTDVFSLGVVLYELLALRRPFEGDTSHQVAAQILDRDPPDIRTIRSRVPRDLAVIAGKALERSREKRYQAMRELAADLRRHLTNEPIHARPPTRGDGIVKWLQRNPAKSTAAAIAAVAVAVISSLLVANVGANRELVRRPSAPTTCCGCRPCRGWRT